MTQGANPPKAFVSWTHGDETWQRTVYEFVLRLRSPGGVDAEVDLFHLHEVGHPWDAYVDKAIMSSDVVLIAVSAGYRRSWEGGNDPGGPGRGSAREARILRGTGDDGIDHLDKAVVVLLPGATERDIPGDLQERNWIKVPTIDLAGLDDVLRLLHGCATFVRNDVSEPPTWELVALSPFDSAGVATVPLVPAAIKQAATPRKKEDGVIAEDRAILQAAVFEARSVEESPATEYLFAELDHSVGAYAAANRHLASASEALPRSLGTYEDAVLRVIRVARKLNDDLSTKRYAMPADSDPEHRLPSPPGDLLNARHIQRVVDFYAVARTALTAQQPSAQQGVIRRTILLSLEPSEHAERLRRRFERREQIAATISFPELGDGAATAAASAALFASAGVTDDRCGEVAADVLTCLAQAHLCLHDVEYRRSMPVGDLLERTGAQTDHDERLLRRSVALNTFTYAISGAMPWIFAASGADRAAIQEREDESPHSLKAAPVPLWLARQVALLSLYRRAHGHKLLGDHQRAYNDLRKLQRNVHLARDQVYTHRDDPERDAVGALDYPRMKGFLETLGALAEYRIGELYRADHDYMQALVHLCRGHERIQHQTALGWSKSDRALLEVVLRIGKGKAFFEIGALKRSLKWYLNAWMAMLDLAPSVVVESESPSDKTKVETLRDYLGHRKHEAEIDKGVVRKHLRAAAKEMVECRIPPSQQTLAADILQRVSHVVMMLRLSRDEPIAKRLLDRAVALDDRSLLVRTGILRWQLRREQEPEQVNPMKLWTTGASDVDQAIRAGEHIMLERLGERRKKDPGAVAHVQVARQLGEHFMTHTDSINLRRAVQHLYLTRSRAEEPPRGAEAPQGGPFLEFVCLRRFGCFTPFMPRPAAVSAVGGGYLVRALWPHEQDPDGQPTVYNILVDPGEGVVNNLYSVGLGIADIDMVVATHDHPDHLSALDALLSLRYEHGQMITRAEVRPKRAMRILGNESVCKRYEFLDGQDGYEVLLLSGVVSLDLAGVHLGDVRLLLRALETNHDDLGGHRARGFILELDAPSWRKRGGAALRITFMSDTGLRALGATTRESPTTVEVEPGSDWDIALQSDIIVAHVSDVPSSEIRELSDLDMTQHTTPATDAFDQCVRVLSANREQEAERLMHALSIVGRTDDGKAAPKHLLEGGFLDRISDPTNPFKHLFLHGLLAIADLLKTKEVATIRGEVSPRVLVIGEFREQLGSFRGTIAREINERVFKSAEPNPRCVALTADIGLRIRVGNEGTRNRVLCSTCSLNNDRFDFERFHAPHKMGEVCVKGDHEAMYWNCPVHIPATRDSPVFVEQMGGYDPFAAGGRYHG